MWVLLIVAVAGRTVASPRDDFWKRLETTDIRDGPALVAFGGWCEEVELPSWAARAYDRALELPETNPARVEAAIALAKLELKEGRHASGYKRLREIVGTHDQEKARELLRLGENVDTRLQRELLKTARKHVESGDLASARDAYMKALDKVLKASSGADFVPAEDIFDDLARCVGAIAKKEADQRAPWTRDSFQPCTQCEDGLQTCTGCDGTGRVSEEKKWFFKGKRKYTKPCGACNSLKYTVCFPCFGFGSELKKGKLAEPSQAAIWGIAGKLGSIALHRNSSSLKVVIEKVEKIVQEDKSDLGKTYFPFIESRYSLAAPLRRELGSVPAPRTNLLKAETAWQATKDFRVKCNLLSGYLCEYSNFLQTLAFLRGAKTTPDVTSPPPATARLSAPTSLWHLAAAPDSATGRWVVVETVFEELGARGHLAVIRTAGQPPIEVFAWLSSAKAALEHLERATGSWSAGVRGLSRSCPFDLHARVAGMQKGQHVRMIGRVLLHPGAFPASKFEVWDIEPGLNLDQEPIRRVLSQPITFTRGGFQAKDLALLLKWHGLRLDPGDVKDGWRFAVAAEGCPLGILIDELSKSLRSTWCIGGTTVGLSTRLPAGAVQDTRAVVTRLSAARMGTIQITAPSGQPKKRSDSTVQGGHIMRAEIRSFGALDSVRFRTGRVLLPAALLGSCLFFLSSSSVHGAEKAFSPGESGKPPESLPDTPSLQLPREDYSLALTQALQKRDSIGDLQIKVSLIPDAYRYHMAREINALRERPLGNPELGNALRSLHGKYKSLKGQPLFLVSMAREGKDSCFFLQGELKKHVSLHTSKPRDSSGFSIDDIRPIPTKEKWTIFETAPEHRKVLNRVPRPAHERELYPFAKLDFTVVGIATLDKAKAGLVLKIGGLVANDGGKKGGRGIHGGKKQLECKDFKYLICESKSFRFERSEWKIPPAPREFEEILARMEKR